MHPSSLLLVNSCLFLSYSLFFFFFFFKMGALKPRIVIVGAGIAGLTAAQQLYKASSCDGNPNFELTVLEASHRIGGRICSSEFQGDRVELGATWIHGIEGSPVYEIACRIGAMEGDIPWERQDGFPGTPLVKAEGGLFVDSAIVSPVVDFYKKLILEVKEKGAPDKAMSKYRSLGAFLRDSFNAFLSQTENVPEINGSLGWDRRGLQDGVFSIHEYMERILTSCNSLFDLDLECEKEYVEYPGEHITIGKGYVSVLNELASVLPSGIIQFGKKVQRFVWNCSEKLSYSSPVVVECEDGSVIEADHVIITVSLGVLKAGTQSTISINGVSKISNGTVTHELFEPPLPPWKLQAISRLGYGVVDKLFLHIDPQAGEHLRSHLQFIYNKDASKSSNNIPWWMKKTFSLCPIYKDSQVVLAWFAGEEAMEMEKLTDEEVMEGVVSTLAEFGYPKKVMGSLYEGNTSSSSDSEESWDEVKEDSEDERGGRRNIFGGVLRSEWGKNSLFNGSYSYAAIGSNGADFETLAEPLPRFSDGEAEEEMKLAPLQLLFAGEATDRHFYSTTHGAYRSGCREASRLIRHYGLSPAASL